MKYLSSNRNLFVLYFIISSLFFTVQCTRKTETTLRDLTTETGLTFDGSEQYVVSKNFLRQGDQNSFWSLEASDSGKTLKIEITTGLSIAEAERIKEERVQMIYARFSNIPSPYPGMVTNKVSVAESLRPKMKMIRHGEMELPMHILASSARYTYGAMSEEMAAFKGGLLFLYDKSRKNLYRLDYYVPKDKFTEEKVTTFFSHIRLTDSPPQDKTADKSLLAEQKDMASPEEKSSLQLKEYNLILIAFEPLGANHVSGYGYDKQTTPNLDAFAKESLLFENAVSPSSWSLPVFMSWFTSLYPSQHKVTNKYSTYTEDDQVLANLSNLSPLSVTLTQVLKRNGYRTAGFTGGASLARDFGFNLGFDEYFDNTRLAGFELTMPRALQWLDSHKEEKFFLFVQGYDVHGQYPLNRQHLDQFLDQPYEGTYKGTEDEYWALRNKSVNEGRADISDEDMRLWKAVYDTKIYDADKRFGAFISKLQELDLLNKSIIIVSAGSGNEYGEHGRIDHGFSLYEELLYVPLIIRIPGRQGRITDMVRTIDIMPTVIDLLEIPLDAPVDKQMQGVSLAPVINGAQLDLVSFSETNYLQSTFMRSIKTNDGWKFILSLDTEQRELYNLKDDPIEQINLVGTQKRIAYELEQKLFEHLKNISPAR